MSCVPADDAEQLSRFDRLRGQFATRLGEVQALDDDRFVRSDWAGRNHDLAQHLLPVPPRGFLHHPAILFQMFVGEKYLAHELPYVLGHLPAVALAHEDQLGEPPRTVLDGHGVTTSSNTVHHLHHLLRYQEATGRSIGDVDTVVEWGGGYGNLAKVFLRLHGGTPTYVLIDTPVFAAVQWLYLASILGDEAVTLQSRPGTPLAEGMVNVVPIGLMPELEVDADLFISTWALNESTVPAQQHVRDRRWFGAGALLLAMHAGDPLAPVVLSDGAQSVELGSFMPGQRYLVR